MPRAVLVATALVAGLVTAAPPAHAEPGAVVLVGTLTLEPGRDCFYPYNPCWGTAVFTATGTHSGTVHATFGYDVPQMDCPLVLKMAGRLTGAINGSFTWSQVDAVVFGQVDGEVRGDLHGYVVPLVPADCDSTGTRDYPAVVAIAGT